VIVANIVSVLKMKRKLWENLENIESQNMDGFLVDVLRVSRQIEKSREGVSELLNDFSEEVRANYTYYHKYMCFKSLFFDSNYKKAALFQRRMEDAWQLSKAQ
jgi:hypothetical protein